MRFRTFYIIILFTDLVMPGRVMAYILTRKHISTTIQFIIVIKESLDRERESVSLKIIWLMWA